MKKNLKYITLTILFIALPSCWLFANTLNDKAVLFSVIELVKKSYVKEKTDKELVELALNGMLSGLDPHSSFINEKEFEDLKNSTKGEFGGIGVEIMVESPGLKVISPIDDTPAFKAGIKPADMIYAINDELIANMNPNEAINKMRGPKNTKVKISIFREGTSEPLELSLVRDIIKANPVKFHLYGDYAYIRIASFTMQTAESTKKAIEELKKQAGNNKIKGYVLDLRNNPGGILEQSVYVTDMFLEKGKIVSTKGRETTEQMSFSATPDDLIKNIPMVVLINNGSASASEIVAGALQDNKRAIVIGTKSFGKGSVQSVLTLPGYGALKLTTSFYYTPSGKSIQAEGIVPDIIVEPAKVELLNSKDKKMQISEANLKNHLLNSTNYSSKQDVEKTKAEFWKNLYDQDYQLARSLDVLKTIVILKEK